MNDVTEIRRGDAADAEAIRALTRQAYAKWTPVIGREARPMTVDYEEAVRTHRFDLLHVDGALAGLIETVVRADHLLIENVAVIPALQRRGYGRTLIAHAERMAAAVGLSKVRLYTNKAFADNARLYASLGYRVDSEEAIADGVVVHMSKPLRS